MFHHNDDLGNPFRGDVEEDLIAWIPGEMVPHFIQSTKTGKRIRLTCLLLVVCFGL